MRHYKTKRILISCLLLHVHFHVRRRGEESSLQQTWRIEVLRKSLLVKKQRMLSRQVQPVRQHGASHTFSYMTRKIRSHSGIKHRFTSKVFSAATTWCQTSVPDLSHLQEWLLVTYCNSSVLLGHISSWDFLDISRGIQLWNSFPWDVADTKSWQGVKRSLDKFARKFHAVSAWKTLLSQKGFLSSVRKRLGERLEVESYMLALTLYFFIGIQFWLLLGTLEGPFWLIIAV